MFSVICIWINDGVNTPEAGDLGRYRAQYDVIVMFDENFTEICCLAKIGNVIIPQTWFEPIIENFKVLWNM